MESEIARSDATLMLREIADGSTTAPERLLELVYDDLRRLAGAYMQNERPDHTLQATALVHEAYMRLVDWKNVSWQSRAHFFSVAAQVMRNVLVDHARTRSYDKRRGQRLLLDDAISIPNEKEIDLIALEDALTMLEKLDPRQAKIVELKFFGGLTVEEVAYVLKIGESTVRRDWTFAKAWLKRELARN